MYAYEVSPLMVVDDFKFNEDKFTNREKGGTEKDFNCIPLRLTLEDLNNLEKEIMSGKIFFRGKSGFFFGSGEYDDYARNDDLNFVYDAKRAIASGNAVYYNSWW
jgi:hypothetical protein